MQNENVSICFYTNSEFNSRGEKMDRSSHTLACLFDQLGLDSSQEGMQMFISMHRGLPAHITLAQADCWNKSQANFLQEAVNEDSDWSEVVDSLNSLLRK